MAETIVELFEEQVHRSSVRPALRRYRDGQWEETSWTEWWDASERLAAGLIASGLRRRERVCLLSSTRREWVVVEMGIAMAGGVSIPLHASTSSAEIGRVLRENEVDTVFVEDPVQLAKITELGDDLPPLRQVIYFEEDVLVDARSREGRDIMRIGSLTMAGSFEVLALEALQAMGRAALAEEPRYVARRRRNIESETVATIVYTSGVSDRPRPVVLTHANLAAQVRALAALQLFSSEDVQLLALPLAHIFARMMYLAGVCYGMTTVFSRGPSHLMDDLVATQPTLMASVPRVYERLRTTMVENIEERRWRSRLLPVALEVGRAVSRRARGEERVGPLLALEHRLFRNLLLEDLHQHLGGRMRFLICGGAPLAKETSEFFFAAGLLLLEGYGLTETCGAVSFNMPDDFRFGTAGKPLAGVDVTIAEDGEILVRGETVMRPNVQLDDSGFRGIDEDGWLHTEDIGHFDRDGFLHLTDRKREMIVTSKGEHVVPASLERELSDHPLVAHALLLGEGRPFLAALLALDADKVLAFVREHHLDPRRPPRELLASPEIHRELTRHIQGMNRRRPSYERVREFVVIPEFLTSRSGTLSASGSLRRMEVVRRHDDLVEALFAGS